MITAAVLCPHPPLLFRELGGRRDPVAAMRQACLEAVGAAIAAGADRVAVIGCAEVSRTWDPALGPEVRRFGTSGPPMVPGLPLSLGVARRLLDELGWAGGVEMHSVGPEAGDPELAELSRGLAHRPERLVLMVMGEGSIRRGEQAPGFIDERAFPFDAATRQALGSGDVEALLRTDPDLARELVVSGRRPWRVLAGAVRAEGWTPRAALRYADDPYGVMYFVALWMPPG